MTRGTLLGRVRRPALAAVSIWVGLLSSPRVGTAQGGEWPTLSGAGVEYMSRSGFLQVSLSGQLDLEALHVGSDRWAGLVGGEGADSVPADWVTACAGCHTKYDVEPEGKGGGILAHRLRLFADVFLGDRVYALVEARSDRGHAPSRGSVRARIEQAYLRVANGAGSMGLQAGRFASPFGAYALRHGTVVDPFLRPPLAYDYRTIMNRSHAPGGAAGFLTWQNWPELFRLPGVPPVWDVPYQWGAMAFGRLGPLDLRAAAMNSAPSSKPDAWGLSSEHFRHPSWVVGVRGKPSASLELGASYNHGPWLDEITAGTIQPVGGTARSRWDFDQEMVSADVAYARGPTMLRGEVIIDRWEVPNIASRLTEVGYNVEVQTDVTAGVSAAARVGYIDFRPISAGAAPPVDWDRDVVRLEGSLGYRLVRNAGVLLSGYWQDAGRGGTTLLSGLRMWWAF